MINTYSIGDKLQAVGGPVVVVAGEKIAAGARCIVLRAGEKEQVLPVEMLDKWIASGKIARVA